MIKAIKNILFTTNLSQECQYAFHYAVSLAARYHASITLLHVIEKLPQSIESRLGNFLGAERWEQAVMAQAKDARQRLIGKKQDHELIEIALERFCEDSIIDNGECHFDTDEIIVKKGNVVQEILNAARIKNSDMIILGSRKSIMKETPISKTMKGIVQRTAIPVLLVPPPGKKQSCSSGFSEG